MDRMPPGWGDVLANPRVQASDSRVTTLAEERKGRATRPAPDAQRSADCEGPMNIGVPVSSSVETFEARLVLHRGHCPAQATGSLCMPGPHPGAGHAPSWWPATAARGEPLTSWRRDRGLTEFRPTRTPGYARFAPCGSTPRREGSASGRWEYVERPTGLTLQGRGVAWNGLPNRRVQRPHSRVTARAYCRTGRATRRAADARR